MIHDAPPPARRRRRRSRLRLLAPAFVLAIVYGALPRASLPDASPPDEPASVPAQVSEPEAASRAPAPVRYGWILDPSPVLGANTASLSGARPLGTGFERPSAPVAVARAAPLPLPLPMAVAPAVLALRTVPLPIPRPIDLRRQPEPVRLAQRPEPARTRVAAQQNAEAERSFFDAVFGTRPEAAPAPALAYAPAEAALPSGPRRLLGPVAPEAGPGVAVYDISARTVTLPSGERLEAHSGLGGSMDDPRFVHLRMRGATPPGTYDLRDREALFHGVRAIRLNPVGGSRAIFGRDGLLAHTYMLGPSGASNGCVSFRDYNRFLQAYLRGEVQRLVVVAGNRQDKFPAFAERLFGRSGR